ncbi:MAG TPA: hypothetical protein VF805_14565 [Anaeromyxobacteraceae bacterium]
MDSNEKQRRRELELRRQQEEKDLETERTIGQRPLEGFSGGHTSWTGDQDDAAAREVHGDDERVSRARSEAQVPRRP